MPEILERFPKNGNHPSVETGPTSSSTSYSIHRRVCVAFAMTIAKSQGQTCKGRVAVYMPEPVFEHGSLYVALSRVTMRKIYTSVSQKESTCRRAARVRARQAAER